MDTSLFKYVLPEELLRYFDIERVVESVIPSSTEHQLHIYLTEKNQLPEGYVAQEWESKGFYDPKTITDFPLRGKLVYLVLKCRRWRNKAEPGRIIRRDFSFLAQGVKMTADLTAFLKQAGRNT